jgi:hypothetical protein
MAMIVGLASKAPAAAGPENRDASMTGAFIGEYITCAVDWDILGK